MNLIENTLENSSLSEKLVKHSVTKNIYDTFQDADAIVILTEWVELAEIEWEVAYKMMRKPGWVFDSRSIVKSREVLKANLNLWRIGDVVSNFRLR